MREQRRAPLARKYAREEIVFSNKCPLLVEQVLMALIGLGRNLIWLHLKKFNVK